MAAAASNNRPKQAQWKIQRLGAACSMSMWFRAAFGLSWGSLGVQVAWNKAELSAHDMEPEQQERLFSGDT
jgi:hypothetical protein